MKNLVYLGTALHMIFLANLSPCQAMEEERPAQKSIPKQFAAVDAEGKKGIVTLSVTDDSAIISPTEVLKLSTIFALHPSKMEEKEVNFKNGYTSAESALADILNHPMASNAQKKAAQSWLDQTLTGQGTTAEATGAITSRFKTLTAEKNSLTSQVSTLTEEKNGLSKQVQTLTGEKEGLMGQVQTLGGEKEGLMSQVSKLTEEKNGLSTQVKTLTEEKKTLTQAAEKAKALETFERIVTSLVSGDKDLAMEYLQGLGNNPAYQDVDNTPGKANTWKTALKNSQNQGATVTENEIGNINGLVESLIANDKANALECMTAFTLNDKSPLKTYATTWTEKLKTENK
jgi:uncharacterized protein YoxC